MNQSCEVACNCGATTRLVPVKIGPSGFQLQPEDPRWYFRPGSHRPGWVCGKIGHLPAEGQTR